MLPTKRASLAHSAPARLSTDGGVLPTTPVYPVRSRPFPSVPVRSCPFPSVPVYPVRSLSACVHIVVSSSASSTIIIVLSIIVLIVVIIIFTGLKRLSCRSDPTGSSASNLEVFGELLQIPCTHAYKQEDTRVHPRCEVRSAMACMWLPSNPRAAVWRLQEFGLRGFQRES